MEDFVQPRWLILLSTTGFRAHWYRVAGETIHFSGESRLEVTRAGEKDRILLRCVKHPRLPIIYTLYQETKQSSQVPLLVLATFIIQQDKRIMFRSEKTLPASAGKFNLAREPLNNTVAMTIHLGGSWLYVANAVGDVYTVPLSSRGELRESEYPPACYNVRQPLGSVRDIALTGDGKLLCIASTGSFSETERGQLAVFDVWKGKPQPQSVQAMERFAPLQADEGSLTVNTTMRGDILMSFYDSGVGVIDRSHTKELVVTRLILSETRVRLIRSYNFLNDFLTRKKQDFGIIAVFGSHNNNEELVILNHSFDIISRSSLSASKSVTAAYFFAPNAFFGIIDNGLLLFFLNNTTRQIKTQAFFRANENYCRSALLF